MVEEVARNRPRGTEHGSREEVSQDAAHQPVRRQPCD